ncbi:MAG: hypothetical protein EBZ67_05330, partial [Chitinophagia bacterium]|nr:hypothetical protein [Chitinophagia bacterium]
EKGLTMLLKGQASSSQAWHPRRCHAEPMGHAEPLLLCQEVFMTDDAKYAVAAAQGTVGG